MIDTPREMPASTTVQGRSTAGPTHQLEGGLPTLVTANLTSAKNGSRRSRGRTNQQ